MDAMQQNNPYETPKSHIENGASSSDNIVTLNRIASGQRLMIFSVLMSLLAFPLQGAIGRGAMVVSVVASILAIIGVARLSGALGRAKAMTIVFSIGMLFPLINLLIMLLLSSQATDRLRAGGYKVGFFGARVRSD
jgi:hypothetical protein